MSETEQKLRSLLGEALGTLRAIESTYDDDELRERAGEAYIDLQNRMPALAAAPQAQEPTDKIKAAYLAGFCAAGEGWNGEYPFGDMGVNPETDVRFLKQRDEDLHELLAGK